jgi:hypothetical protein
MGLTEEEQDIEKLKNAVERQEWEEVNTLLLTKHCMKFFRGKMKYMHGMVSIYIKSVEYGYENLSGAIESYFYSNKAPSCLIPFALSNENPILFFQNVKQEALDIILVTFQCNIGNQYSQILKNNPSILERLSKCQRFPSGEYLIKFIQDLEKEINDGADSSATKEAIKILINVHDWGYAQCEEIINNTKSLSAKEQESLGPVLNLSVFSTSIKSARNVAYEWQSSSDQISAGENDNNDNSSNNGLNQKQLLDQVAPESQEVKQETQEASIVLEEVISDNVIEELVEKVKPIPQWFVLSDWQKSALQRLVPTSMASGYPLLKQHKTPLLLCWHSENNAHHKPFLGDAARVDEDAFATYEALLAEVD